MPTKWQAQNQKHYSLRDLDFQSDFTEQISFNVLMMDELQYFTEYMRMANISKFEQAKFTMYVTDNLTNVKRTFAMHAGEKRTQVMSGAFVINGKLLDPSKENTTFENLMLDE